jgi:hypothetical protein
MQPKFTLKSIWRFIKFSPLAILFVCFLSPSAIAQTTVSTTGFANNNQFALVTFNFRNNNASAVIITDFASIVSVTGAVDVAAFFKPSAINGAPGTIDPGNGWNQFGSATIAGVANTTTTVTQPFMSGLNLMVPAGATYGIAIQARISGGGAGSLRYSTIAAGTYTFSGGGCDLITGTNIGYAGDVAPNAPTFTPRGYLGSVTFTSAVPCSGTPSPGNTISSSNPVCPSVNFTLSLQNATPGSGVTYQWQSSPDGSTWSNIGGATNSTYTTSITTATWYRCQVTCSGNTGTSNPVQVNMNPPTACYCIPPATNCTDNDVITRVRISTLDNPSACGVGPPAGYTNYTTTVAAPEVYLGVANQMIVDAPPNWSEFIGVWIDYNQNGQFEASEFTNLGNKPAGQTTVTGNINIPGTALTGITRMRVRIRFAAALGGGDACLGYTFGETEDYNVNIVPCIPGVITTHPANATTQCSGNASFSAAASGSLITWTWEYRVNASSPWQNLVNGGSNPAVSGATTGTVTLTGVPSIWNGYQVRAIMSGACTGFDPTNPATLTVGPLIATVIPTSANICFGSIQQLTLTNVLSPTNLVDEGFNTVAPLPTGWAAQNLSSPLGAIGWFQGNSGVFPAQSGPATSYIAANWQNTTTTGVGTISNWLFLPNVTLRNGDILRFWTRRVASSFPDRLQVRMSTNGASTNAGATATSVGDFTTLLLDINPTYTTTGYPTVWTQYSITLSGLPGPISGRLAFRYFVENAGGLGANSDYIGIDNVTYTTGGVAQGIWTSNQTVPPNTIYNDAAATSVYTGGLANTVYVQPVVNTIYSVVFSTNNPACTSLPTNIPVNVVFPVTNVVNPINRSACIGGSATFTASASGGPLTYQWQLSTNGGVTYTNISGATSASYTVSNATSAMNNYRYRVIITASPCSGSVTTTAGILTVNAPPTVTISAAPLTQLMPGQTTNVTATSNPAGASYSWTFNGQPISATGASISVDVDGIGTYQVTVTDVNGCVSTSAPFTLGGRLSDKLFIYPNPAPNGQFQVRVYSGINFDYRKINIYNSNGQRVVRRDVNTAGPWQRIDFNLAHLPNGVYIVEVLDKFDTKLAVGKMVIGR